MSSTNSSEPFSVLCNALELGKTERALSVLQQHAANLDLSRVNEDGFAPIELLFMMDEDNRNDILPVLMNAAELKHVERREGDVEARLKALLHESKRQVEKFGQLRKSASSSALSTTTPKSSGSWPSSLTSDQLRECAKQQGLWSKRCTTLTKMLNNWLKCGRPHAPDQVQIHILSKGCVELSLGGGLEEATHCRVQWSRHATFREIEGEKVVSLRDRTIPYRIRLSNLSSHRRMYLRLALGSPRGFGPFCMATPASFVASSWRKGNEDDLAKERNKREECLENLLQAIITLTQNSNTSNSNTSNNVGTKEQGGKKGGLIRQLIVNGLATNTSNNGGHNGSNNGFVIGSSSATHMRLSRVLSPNKLYLAHVLFHEDKVLLGPDDSLPLLEVCETSSNLSVINELGFLFKLGHCGSEHLISDGDTDTRMQLVRAIAALAQLVDEPKGSVPFCRPIIVGDNTIVLALIKKVRNERVIGASNNGLKWTPIARAKHGQEGSVMDILRSRLRDLLVYTQRLSSGPPASGLVLCLVQGETHVGSRRGVEVRVDEHWPMLAPFAVIRERSHITHEEWDWLRALGQTQMHNSSVSGIEAPSPTTNFLSGEEEELLPPPCPQLHSDDLEAVANFGSQICKAANTLMEEVGVEKDIRPHMRLYTGQVHELSPELSVLYLLPPSSSLVTVSSSPPSTSCSWLSLSLQEHLSSLYFWPRSTSLESQISVLLQLWTHRARRQLRVAFSADEGRLAKSLLESLETFKAEFDELASNQLGISSIIHKGRDKVNHQCVLINTVNSGKDDLRRLKAMKPRQLMSSLSSSSSRPWTKHHADLLRFNSSRSEPMHYANIDRSVVLRKSNNTNANLDDNNVLQVYAAYETGLASGTSVKLTVSALTSAREVVDLVVRQLNMALLLKGREGPVYGPEQLQDFCLVAVIGSRERGLRDDFKPLHLQNPWKKGKLFVRRKDDFANNNGSHKSSISSNGSGSNTDSFRDSHMSAVI